jgi:hypothetical protein
MSLAAAGKPTKLATLTCSPLAAPSALAARTLLHQSWRTLRLRIAREFARPVGERWRERRNTRGARVPQHETAPRNSPNPRDRATLAYFAVVEKHKSGRPHLHILLRCDYIPQRWLSRQMQQLAGSPICDIRQIKTTKQAVAYVAKYIGKAPARFGTARSYWYTKNWSLSTAQKVEVEPQQKRWFSAKPMRWSEIVTEIDRWRPIIDVTPDGWFALSPRAAPMGAKVRYGVYGPFWERGPPEASSAAEWGD